MRLIELADGCLDVPARLCDLEVTGLTSDSREVQPGFLFVAVKGELTDGHLYVAKAEAAGAVAVVGDAGLDPVPILATGVNSRRTTSIPYLRVADSRQALAQLGANFYGSPQDAVTLAGVTGTKGKTTTSWILECILRSAGKRTALFGTVCNRVGDEWYPSRNTTPSILELLSSLQKLVATGGTHAVLEVSSHGIAQRRIANLDFRCGILTNVAPEHLDYHGTFENYVAVKTRFFEEFSKESYAVLPRDDEIAARIASRTNAEICWYGADSQDGVDRLRMEPGNVTFTWRGCSVRTRLWGLHNLQNVLAAMTAAECLGLRPDEIAAGVEQATAPPGRLEEVEHPGDFHVFVDYAHTDGSLESVLQTLRDTTQGRLITVFGCGGDRDREKRPRMGRVAERFSDHVVITSDNPRSEDPIRILDEISAGLETPDDAVLEPDRREAIGLTVRMARQSDVILIAGKGHEDYQELAEGRIPFDDREVAHEFLQERMPL
jgi:UDP-N-acetylmuramoyl-L-alanyl-D-glutamate--2,6-diaminopimelate ligase